MKRLMLLTLTVVAVGCISTTQKSAPVQGEATGEKFSALAREMPVGHMKDRAFWGAPPLIPHRVKSERRSASCLECHSLERRVGLGQRATAPVPHAEFSQCLQCHVKGYEGRHETPWVENAFEGLVAPGPGVRAHEYAPPTVPHGIFLRENCLSCHGPKGDTRLQTAHPERSQCLQCHLLEAAVDYTRSGLLSLPHSSSDFQRKPNEKHTAP